MFLSMHTFSRSKASFPHTLPSLKPFLLSLTDKVAIMSQHTQDSKQDSHLPNADHDQSNHINKIQQ